MWLGTRRGEGHSVSTTDPILREIHFRKEAATNGRAGTGLLETPPTTSGTFIPPAGRLLLHHTPDAPAPIPAPSRPVSLSLKDYGLVSAPHPCGPLLSSFRDGTSTWWIPFRSFQSKDSGPCGLLPEAVQTPGSGPRTLAAQQQKPRPSPLPSTSTSHPAFPLAKCGS